MIRAQVVDVTYLGGKPQHQLLALLQEEGGERVFSILMEGWAYEDFVFGLRGLSYGRPTFSTFLTQALVGAGSAVEAVRIDADPAPPTPEIWMVVFRAWVTVRQGDQTYELEGRPSYALPLALITGCPILVEEPIFTEWSTPLPPHLTGAVGLGLEALTQNWRKQQPATEADALRDEAEVAREEHEREEAIRQLAEFLFEHPSARTNAPQPEPARAWWRFWQR